MSISYQSFLIHYQINLYSYYLNSFLLIPPLTIHAFTYDFHISLSKNPEVKSKPGKKKEWNLLLDKLSLYISSLSLS